MSKPLADQLARLPLTGYQFRDVEISMSDNFREMNPGRRLPEFKWFDVTGSARKDDFGLEPNGMLVVSEQGLQALQKGNLEHCDISNY